MIFHENYLLADDSQEYHIIFQKLGKISQSLSSAAVVIGALRVNQKIQLEIVNIFLPILHNF